MPILINPIKYVILNRKGEYFNKKTDGMIFMKNRIKWFSNLSIKNKVQYIFTSLMIVTVLLCFVFFLSVTKVKLTQTYISKTEDKMNSIYKGYTDVIEKANSISKLILVNDSVLTYLRDDMVTSGRTTISDDMVRAELYRIINSFSGGYTAFLLKQRKVPVSHIIRTDSEPMNEVLEMKTSYVNTSIGIMRPFSNVIFSDSWYGKVSELKGGYMVFPNNMGAFSFNTNTEIISFTRVINDIDTQKPIGLLIINIAVSELEQTYENFDNTDNSFAFVDENGKIICSAMERREVRKLINSNKKLITADNYHVVNEGNIISGKRITDTGIHLICTSKMSLFEGISMEMVFTLLGILIIMFIMISLTRLYINKYIILPVTMLSDTMQKSESVPVQITDVSENDDEIGRLQMCYNDMAAKINRLIEEVVEQEQQIRKAEMTVVQEQMKPHFLYNTLDTIGLMALQNSREEVYDAIETLGTFYRKFLSKGNETITISDEISIVKSYVKLLRLRYDDMFEDEYCIQENLNSVMIMKLILQPLVENAIYHGIRPKGEHGIIRISVFSENNRIHIQVYDSGIGMSAEQINRLINSEDEKSFGFRGTVNRIRGFYQNDAYVSIKSVEGEFCEIDINIPER